MPPRLASETSPMKRPLWFRRKGFLRWTPCAWQGWLAAGVVGIIACAVWQWRIIAPIKAVLALFALVVLSAALAARTDDTHLR